MGFGVSIFLIAVGAILAFAVNVTSPGLDLNAVGVILMLIGVIGLFLSALWWYDVFPWTSRRTYVRDYDDDVHEPPARPRRRRREIIERRDTHL